MDWTKSMVSTYSTASIASNIPAFANGGYVYPQAGGAIVRVAEAGKPEHIVGDDKLRQVVREEMNTNYQAAPTQIILQVGEHEFGSFLIDLIKGEVRRTGVSLA